MFRMLRALVSLVWNLLALLGWPLRAIGRWALGLRGPEWVELRLAGPLRYRKRRPGWLERHLSRAPSSASIEEVADLCDRIVASRRCRGLLVRADGIHGSWAQLDALSAQLQRVHAAGRQVVVWAEALDGRSYAALCGVGRLVLPPSGTLDLTGPSLALSSAGAALGKLGLRPEFFRREEHKTAPELFTRVEASEAQRETARGLLAEAHRKLSETLGKRLPPGEVQSALDRGPLTGRSALAAGLVDRVGFVDEALRELAPEKTRPGSGRRLRPGLPPLGLVPLRRGPAVGLVTLRGLIREGRSAELPTGGRFFGSQSAAELLQAIRRDRSVRSVLLYVDSRGGSAGASELIWHEIERTAAEKPVVAYVDAVAASGGYFAACGATRIVAAPLAIVGSIGVFYGRFDPGDALIRIGVRRELLRTSATSGLAQPWGAMNAEERAAADRIVGELYEEFLQVVAKSRRRTVEEIRAVAGGRIYTGQRAREIGLVDEVGGFARALELTAELGGIRGKPKVRAYGSGAAPLSWAGAVRDLAIGSRAGPLAFHDGPSLR